MWKSAQTCNYATNLLPLSHLWIRDCWPLSNGSRIHIIFLKVYLDYNISHANTACFPKFTYRKQPAFGHVIDEQVSRARGQVMGIVPGIYVNLEMLHLVPNSSVSKILRTAQNF